MTSILTRRTRNDANDDVQRIARRYQVASTVFVTVTAAAGVLLLVVLAAAPRHAVAAAALFAVALAVSYGWLLACAAASARTLPSHEIGDAR